MTKEEVLQNCTVEGTTIKLPAQQLDRKLYQDVAKSLELIGGKWKGGKVAGFVFNEDPTELLQQIANGEKRNLKKEFQFFITPASLARELVFYADIDKLIKPKILEPSAGQGAIVKAIFEKGNVRQVDCCELMPLNQIFLDKIDGTLLIASDFLTLESYTEYYDRIIANPPFSCNQDIDHIKKMYDCLKKGGRLVSIASSHWQISSNRKETEFKNWLDSVEAEIIPIPKGAFKESGTEIGGVIIIINK
jgi:phospholipid N-methyltransferase